MELKPIEIKPYDQSFVGMGVSNKELRKLNDNSGIIKYVGKDHVFILSQSTGSEFLEDINQQWYQFVSEIKAWPAIQNEDGSYTLPEN